MQMPLQVTFRGFPSSDAVESTVRDKVDKLQRLHPHIMGCRVTIESPHQHHYKGKLFRVAIEISVPQGDLVVSREPHKRREHEDVYIAIRDAFDAAKQQLATHRRRRVGDSGKPRMQGAKGTPSAVRLAARDQRDQLSSQASDEG